MRLRLFKKTFGSSRLPLKYDSNASRACCCVTEKGMTIRVRCADIRSVSRNAQGVTLAKMEPGDKIARIAPVVKDEDDTHTEESAK